MKTKTKLNLIFALIAIIVFILTYYTGRYCKMFLFSSGANHITFSDISACYGIPFMIYAILGLFIFLSIEEKL